MHLFRSSAIVLALCLAATSCGSSPTTDPAASSGFDAIGVIGHSGATGANSEGDGSDVRENSWATGDNDDVDSIYLRLLADHPALKGHNFNTAEDGSDSSLLMEQAEQLLAM